MLDSGRPHLDTLGSTVGPGQNSLAHAQHALLDLCQEGDLWAAVLACRPAGRRVVFHTSLMHAGEHELLGDTIEAKIKTYI